MKRANRSVGSENQMRNWPCSALKPGCFLGGIFSAVRRFVAAALSALRGFFMENRAIQVRSTDLRTLYSRYVVLI